MKLIVHNFKKSLKRSHMAASLPLWRECYHQAFYPDAHIEDVPMHDHRQDGPHQRQGIDRSVILPNGQPIWIDEKVRWRNEITGIVYRDIALEEFSSIERKSPGWVVKSLFAHYIAYAIAPLGQCWLLPVLQLQQAWLRNSGIWKKAYPHPIRALNDGWVTLSWRIPPDVLMKAIGSCLRVTFKPIDIDENGVPYELAPGPVIHQPPIQQPPVVIEPPQPELDLGPLIRKSEYI